MLFNALVFSPTTYANSDLMLTSLFKIFFVIGAILYLVFSFVVIRQISVMRSTLITTFSPVIRTIGFLHLALAIGVLLFYLFVL